jgi:hypothetical protein
MNSHDLFTGSTTAVCLAAAETNIRGACPLDALPWVEELARRAQQNDTDRATVIRLGTENLELRQLLDEVRGQLEAVRRAVRDHDYAGAA